MMSLELRCEQCGQLLSTVEENAGKLIRCVRCAAIVVVRHRPSTNRSPGARNVDVRNVDANDDARAYGENDEREDDEREDNASAEGLPWEQGPKSASRFWQTTLLLLGSPTLAYSRMRRDGAWSGPLVFGMLWSLAGGLFSVSFTTLGKMALAAAFGTAPPAADAPPPILPLSGGEMIALSYLLALVMGTVGFVMTVFTAGGLNHLVLWMLGGARGGYETTCRVVAYSIGATSVFQFIPFVGSMVAFFASSCYQIAGLSAAHRIPYAKSALAVFLPMIVCCSTILVGLGALFMVGLSWIGKAT